METQNVTLALPKDTLRKAKRLAVNRHMSLSGLMVQLLTEPVEQDDLYRAAAARQPALLARGLELGTYGHPTWTREELHEPGALACPRPAGC